MKFIDAQGASQLKTASQAGSGSDPIRDMTRGSVSMELKERRETLGVWLKSLYTE